MFPNAVPQGQKIDFGAKNMQPTGAPFNPTPVGGANMLNKPTTTGASGLLSAPSRTKLDGIVQQMIQNKESDAYIQNVVNDFKSKYSQSAVPETPQYTSAGTNIAPLNVAKGQMVAQTALGQVIQQFQEGAINAASGLKDLVTGNQQNINPGNVSAAYKGGGIPAATAETGAQIAYTPLKAASQLGQSVGGILQAVSSPLAPVFNAVKPIGEQIGRDYPESFDRFVANAGDFLDKNPVVTQTAGDVLNASSLALPEGAPKAVGLARQTLSETKAAVGEGLAKTKSVVGSGLKNPVDALRGFVDAKAKQSISTEVGNLLKSTKGIGKKTATAERTGTDFQKTISDPQVFNGLKVEGGKINPDAAVDVVDERINALMDSKSAILPEVDKIANSVSRETIRQKAYAEIAGKSTPAQEDALKAAIDAEVDRLPERMKPSEVDRFRAQARQSGRDAKGQLKSSNEYAALENASRDTIFDITDNLPVPNASEYKALNDYIKQMISTRKFLNETLRGQTVKGGRLGNYSGKMIGAIAGSSHGPLGTLAGQAIGGVVADIITNNALGSSLKMSLIRTLTDDPAIIQQAEKLMQDVKNVPPPLQLPAGPIPMGRGADTSGVKLVPAQKTPLPTVNPKTGRMQRTYLSGDYQAEPKNQAPSFQEAQTTPTTINSQSIPETLHPNPSEVKPGIIQSAIDNAKNNGQRGFIGFGSKTKTSAAKADIKAIQEQINAATRAKAPPAQIRRMMGRLKGLRKMMND